MLTKQQQKRALCVALCALTFVASLVAAAAKPKTNNNNKIKTQNVGTTNISNSFASSHSGPAIATSYGSNVPYAAPAPVKVIKRVVRPAPAPVVVEEEVVEPEPEPEPSNPELDAALAALLALEENPDADFEHCDNWNKARIHYEQLAGDAVVHDRPNAASKAAACHDYVEYLANARLQMEELAAHLHDLVTGASTVSRLDLVAELANDHKELSEAFKVAPMLKDEFEDKVKTDERLGDNYLAFEGLIEELRNLLTPSLAEQLKEHEEFLPALGDLEHVLPALESLKEVAEKVNGSVDKLRNVAGVEPGFAAAASAEPSPDPEPEVVEAEPEPEPEPVPRAKLSELGKKFHN